MGSTQSVPPAFELTVVDGRHLLSLLTPARLPGAALKNGDGRDGGDLGLEASHHGENRDGGEYGDARLFIERLLLDAGPRPAGARGAPPAASTLRNRRTRLRAAILNISLAQLNRALGAVPLVDAGIVDLRVWMAPGGPRLTGTFVAGNHRTPFTIRPAIEPRANGPRRLRIVLSDVRAYAALPLPAPLIGVALARAIGSAAGAAVRRAGPSLDVDPLAMVLEQSLVARGWRLPDLAGVSLDAIDAGGSGAVRLRFGGNRPSTDRYATLPGGTAQVAVRVEGEPLPESAFEAEERLNAGDLAAAEAAFRAAVRESPRARPVRARLLALRCAAGGSDVADLAAALVAEWPDYVPGLLGVALAARAAGDPERAAKAFGRVAELCEAGDERQDATLARAAEAEARAAAEHIRPGPDPSSLADAAETTQQDPIDVDPAQMGKPSGEESSGPAAEPPAVDPSTSATTAPETPEQPAKGEPNDIIAKIETAYRQKDDTDARAQALGRLLDEVEALGPEHQHAAYESFGRAAEAASDLEHAEEAYWRAARVAGDPHRRADGLAAHARVLVARGNFAAANAELEEALAMVPDHAGALTMAAEQAFRARDWQRARRFYALLDQAPGAAELIPRETLVDRRAALARTCGELAEAEACYRELAELSPRHVEAHHALAELALTRDDPRTAADRWEEVLRLLPLDALDALLDVRQRLADVYARLEDWGAARYYAELVLAQDPGRVAMLEWLAEVDERLGLFPAAVEVLGRLARQYSAPARRAEALFRQGEILLERMNDPARAFEAHLKASDLDPTFVPTALRLIEGYWRAGEFGEAAGVGDELRRTRPLPDMTPALRLRWALAAALAWRDPARAVEVSQLSVLTWNAAAAAAALTEVAALLMKRPPQELEPAVAALDLWSAQTPPSPAGADPASAGGLRAALVAQLTQDPATPGAARALGWIADRKGDSLTARTWFGAAAFLDGGDGALARLDELGRAPASVGPGLDLLGPAEHPDASGRAAPLRRALAALAHGLAGFATTASAPSGGVVSYAMPADTSGSILAVDVQDALATLARSMGSPPTLMVPVREPVPAAPSSPAARVRVVDGRPHRLEIPSLLLGIPRDELTFLVALALGQARAGLTLLDLGTDGSAAAVGSVLQGAAAALATKDDAATAAAIDDDLARRIATALAAPDSRAALSQAPGGAATLESDLVLGRDALAEWATFRRAAERASDRFAALACRNPLAALRALYRADAVTAPGAAELSERERRSSFLRTARVRELLQFLSSPAYARSVGITSGDEST